MNRFFSVFMVVAASCTFAFAQSTNYTGNGTQTITFTNFSFSGEAGGDAAALSSLQAFYSTNTAYQGGTGPGLSGDVDLDGGGGRGLYLSGVAESTVVGSEAIGGDAGSVVQNSIAGAASAVGGSGLALSRVTEFAVEGMIVRSGHGGDISAAGGSFKNSADGGSGILIQSGAVKLDIVDSELYGGDGGTVVSGGTESSSAKGGSGVSVQKKPRTKIDSAVFNNLEAFGGKGGSISTLGDADASGGHGVGSTAASGPIVVESGTYVGGSGGIVTGASSASANGGDGVHYIGRATEDNSLIISNGTFQGAAGGTVTGIAGSATANGGNGLYAENATVEIHGGDFSGSAAGTANRAAGADGAGFKLNNVSANIFGGTFDNVLLAGDGASELTITNGTIGKVLLAGIDTATYDLSLGSNAVISNGISQIDGTANFTQWSDQHFTDTTIYGGTMNFSGQTFNLGAGNSFALLGAGSAVDFGGTFVARSNSTMTTTFNETGSSVIEGTDLTFEQGVQWTLDGGTSVVTNNQKIAMASASGTLISDIDLADLTYLGTGGSWAGGIITLDTVANDLSATYGVRRLEDALGLEPGSDFYEAMTQLSDFTDFSNSADDAYVSLKTLSPEMAETTLADGYVRAPEMASALIQLQGLFADQITDRTRSYRRYASSAGSSHAPQGAQGPDAWNQSMDSLNGSLPAWDARESMKDFDESLPRWSGDASAQNATKGAYVHQPKSSKSKIEVPETYQVWGRGYGSYFKQSETDGFGGYDAYVGGGVIGLDKRYNNLLLGLGGGYAHTSLNGNWGSDGEADTGYGTAYAAINGEKGFLDININYAFNDVETEGSPVMGYEGEYDASTVGFYIGGGMGFSTFNDSMLFTPEVSLLSTYYDREGYTETATAVGPYPDKVWEDYDQWSYLSSLGATLSMIHQIESFNLEMEFQPEVRAHWLHEFNADMDADAYLMEGGATPIGVALQAREENLVKVGAGIRFSKWNSDTLEFGLDIDGIFGEDYEAYVFSGKLLHRF